MMVFQKTQAVEERFWSKVDKSGEHWIWRGNTAGGYGQFWMPDRPRPAHVFSWEMASGRAVTEGLIIRHRCDIPLCVHPTCLEEGTNKQNTEDMLLRDRCTGVKYDADLIRRLRSAGKTHREISFLTGISESQSSRICLKQGRILV